MGCGHERPNPVITKDHHGRENRSQQPFRRGIDAGPQLAVPQRDPVENDKDRNDGRHCRAPTDDPDTLTSSKPGNENSHYQVQIEHRGDNVTAKRLQTRNDQALESDSRCVSFSQRRGAGRHISQDDNEEPGRRQETRQQRPTERFGRTLGPLSQQRAQSSDGNQPEASDP